MKKNIVGIKNSIKSISFLWLGSIIGSGSTFIISIVLGKKLGPEQFGVFFSAQSTITVFVLISSFGVSQAWLKLFGKEGNKGLRWVKPSLKLILLMLLVTTFLIVFWSFFGPHTLETRYVLLIMIFYLYGKINIELVSSKLQIAEKYLSLAIWQLIPNVSRLFMLLIFIYALNGLLSPIKISIIYGIVGIIVSIVGIYHLIKFKNFNSIEIKKRPKVSEILKESWPFGFGSLFAFIYVQSDIIMVKYISGDTQAGYYNAAFIFLSAIYILPSTLYQKYLMPKFHKWANYNRKKFYSVYIIGNKIMLVFGIIIMMVVLLTSKYFVPLFFGEKYNESIFLLNILALNLPFYLIAFSAASVLVTQDNMRRKVKYMGIVAILNIILNLILIPKYNARGAAIATLISNATLLLIYLYATKKYVFIETNDK